MRYGYRCKAHIIPKDAFDEILGFHIRTLELLESVLIDATVGGESTQLVNLVMSEKKLLDSNVEPG